VSEGDVEFSGELACNEALDQLRRKWECPVCGADDLEIHYTEVRSIEVWMSNQCYDDSELVGVDMTIHSVKCSCCYKVFTGQEAYDRAYKAV